MNERVTVLKGVPVSEGIGLGTIVVLADGDQSGSIERTIAPDLLVAEWSKLSAALQRASAELRHLEGLVAARIGHRVSDVFHAQSMILEDETFVTELRFVLFDRRIDAAAAVRHVIGRWEKTFRDLQAPHLSERWAEVREVGALVVAALSPDPTAEPGEIPSGAVVVARLLGAATCARLPFERIKGIITEQGGRTSHAFILARAGGIPAATGIANALTLLRNGDDVIIDGMSGLVIANPNDATRREYMQTLANLTSTPVKTPAQVRAKDGSAFEILASIGKSADAAGAMALGADGIGLFRTEFAYMVRPSLPREDEIAEIARFVEERCAPKPVVFRLLDIGGEKTPVYLSATIGTGNARGLRLLLEHRELLEAQLRGLLAGLKGTEVRLLVPMITSIGEFRIVRGLADAIWRSAAKSYGDREQHLRVGAMIETPAAVWIAEDLAKEADFFNVGLNDLTQYTLAVDRDDPLEKDFEPAHPAIERSLRHVFAVAHANKVPVTICGEPAMAAGLFATLAAIGFRSFSVGASSLARVRAELEAWGKE
ncbi:MAG: phosphoenolpyruvate--protein phosphotransferase [Deltaproteobacteria bacterium]|nr:phosphoenolpyruvate--protein phosphotransferase [Deltaproteobacteria bacterium]